MRHLNISGGLAVVALASALTGCAGLSNWSSSEAQQARAQAAPLLPANWSQQVAEAESVESLAERYLELALAMNPTYGVQVGIHGTDADSTLYDRSLPDVSASAINTAYQRLAQIEARLAGMEPASLSEATRVDRRILLSKIRLDQMNLTDLGDVRDPLAYVGILGGAYSGLLLREFAPLEQRLTSLAARCAATERFLEQTRSNLAYPDVQPTAVQKQLVGPRLTGLSKDGGLLRKTVPDLAQQADFGAAERDRVIVQCGAAADAIDGFVAWFGETVAPRPDSEWRLGEALYERKYALYMDYPLGPQELLAAAQATLEARHAHLVRLARKIHDSYRADAIREGAIRPASKLSDSEVVKNVLAKMSEDRPTPDSLIEDSYALADSIVGFVEREDLLELPPTAKLRIEAIPPHLSGYAVAMIQTAPPYEPELDSVWFWDLPMLRAAEGFLKEYNRPALAGVYIHEGVPGHFVQLEYANRAERLVPRVFRNGPMVEGWATYIESQLVDLGYTVYPDHPHGHELQKIANLKLGLRAVINAIIDIRLHTSDWPAEEALALMTDKGFQEPAEAKGKLTRAKLSSVQLASYFAGEHAIREILAEYRRRAGDDFSWKQFNQELLSAGSPPMDVLRERMLGRDG